MKHRNLRLGRAAATLALGAGLVGGVVAGVAGVASATTTPTMAITPTTVPNPVVGTAYSQTLTATEGPAATSTTDTVDWALGGSVPPGLGLATATSSITTSTTVSSSTNDSLTGTPTAVGTYTFTVTAKDATTGATATNPYTVSVTATGITANSVLGSGSAESPLGNPSINSTNSTTPGPQATGEIQLTLAPGTYVNTGDNIQLNVYASGGGTVTWAGTPVVSPTTTGTPAATTGTGTESGSTLTIPLTQTAGGSPSTASETLTVSGLSVTTTGAAGAIEATATYHGSTTTGAAYTATFSGSPATIGTVPAAPTAFNVSAVSQPVIGAGLNGQPAGNWNVTVGGTGSTVGQAWTSGDYIALTVAPASGSECVGTSYIDFAGTPTVTVTGSGVSATPTVTPALGFSGSCNSAEPNVLELQFTNSGTVTSANGSATIAVTGVTYSTGTTTATGAISVTPAYDSSSNTLVSTPTTSGPYLASNANIESLYVTANNPPVTVPPSAIGASISPISLVESQAGKVPSGWVCITLPSGSTFNTAATPTVAVSGGNGTASSTSSYETTTATNDTVAFDVTSASTTGPSTYTISGLSVNAGSSTGPVSVVVKDGAATAATCGTTGTTVTSTTVAFTIGTPSSQIYGQNLNDTAAAELEHEFPPGTACPGGTATTRPVVVATDQNYPDALSGAYLARYLGTGELITPTDSLSSAMMTAIRQEGITNVYVVGGPLAVSQADISQLEATDAYHCGGTVVRTLTTGVPQTLSVTQIYGQTEYGTAQQIAQFAPTSYVGSVSALGAYAGTNSSGGTGMYNDTSGNASAAPTVGGALKTAILAQGQGWQDAESASALSYADALPILLTTPSALSTQAAGAITDLGIQQVIVMGGPIAISNSVVTSLQAMGVSVLRIAGQDYTDTADMLANFEVNTTSGGLGLGWVPNSTVTVARGDFYTDGLAGAVVAANGGVAYNTTTHVAPGIGASNAQLSGATPLLLTFDPSTLGNYLPAFLKQAGSSAGIDNQAAAGTSGDQIKSIVVLGGPLAVTPAEITSMEADL